MSVQNPVQDAGFPDDMYEWLAAHNAKITFRKGALGVTARLSVGDYHFDSVIQSWKGRLDMHWNFLASLWLGPAIANILKLMFRPNETPSDPH